MSEANKDYSVHHVALAAESPEAGRSSTAALSQFLPLTIKGMSMDDGSISFGPRDLKIVLGYITNAVSFGDFVNSAMKGRKDFGAPDTAVTQLACAQEIIRAANQYDNMLAEIARLNALNAAMLAALKRIVAEADSASMAARKQADLLAAVRWEKLHDDASAAIARAGYA